MDVKISPMRPTLQKNKQESWNPIHAITDNYIVVDKPPAIPTVPPRDLGNTGLIPHFLRQVRQGQVGAARETNRSQQPLVPPSFLLWFEKIIQTLPRQIGHGSLLATSRLDAGTHGLVIVGRTRVRLAVLVGLAVWPR
jgi:23S rRNA-/tRNA-specific pseudouridylate synthase